MTFWWVDSSISTNNTVGWIVRTDVTLFSTRWTFRNTRIIKVILTFTKWRSSNSGSVRTSYTNVFRGTSCTSIVTC
jgi:hypothetical protein